MLCQVMATNDMPVELAEYIRRYMTKPGSDFAKKLLNLPAIDGCIAVVTGHNGILGWARAESWQDGDGIYWGTLEAFVAEKYRGTGIASFAAKGLDVSNYFESGAVAVFDPKMMMVARSAGLLPTLFLKDGSGKWVRA